MEERIRDNDEDKEEKPEEAPDLDTSWTDKEDEDASE